MIVSQFTETLQTENESETQACARDYVHIPSRTHTHYAHYY